jgi:hypothetical protein
MDSLDTTYIPGICNINTEEIKKRRMMGHIGLALFVSVLIVLLVLAVSGYYRIIVFLPAMLAASGYLQARNHFCVGYASAGKQNAAPGSRTTTDIVDTTARVRDKYKARTMNLQAAGIALILTTIALLVPHIS